MLLNRLKHVNYNLLRVLRMDKSYQTGLKLKNNLSNELVTCSLMSGRVCACRRQKCALVHMWSYRILE